MSTDAELTQAFVDVYQVTGREVGYWGRRFLQSVKRNGGLATAKRMLKPSKAGPQKGLLAILEANRPELSVEAIVLQPRFRTLFTQAELMAAAERLGTYGQQVIALSKARQPLYPDELPPGINYLEGARKQVRVNSYERDPRARKACLAHHGCICAVCGLNFEQRYGVLGRGFIHVHHLRPLSLTDGEYKLDPVADLRPVCPNCHAMLHQQSPPLHVEELRQLIAQ
jgi:5-methylcytosine-specific restriction enzyme A